MGANTERARRALAAMASLGFSKKEATPVLKSLLRLFANNWEPIEDECYRALADAILDARDHQVNGGPVDDGDQDQEHHPRSNTIISLALEYEPSTSLAARGVSCDSDKDTSPPRIKTNFTTNQNHRGDSPHPQSPPSTARAQDASMAISPQGASPELTHQTRASTRSRKAALHKRPRQMMDQVFQHAVFLKEPKPELDMDAQLGFIAHPYNASSSGIEVPQALPTPDQNPSQTSGAKSRTIQRCRKRKVSTSFVEPTNHMVDPGTGSGVENMQEAPCLDIDVASSTMDEVKMSLKCSVDPSKFRMPALEAVFKMVEDKCLRSHKILPPDFSIGSLMNEICQCVLQLGSNHTAEQNIQSDNVGNGSGSQNESMIGNDPFIKSISCHSGGNGKYKAAEKSLVLKDSEVGPLDSTVAQQQHYLALSTLRPIHDVTDISKGEERIRISFVDEFGSEKCPSSFYYIPRNLVFQNAYVNISVARIGDEDCCADCFGNCLSAPMPCACARETGGDYAYTPEGLIRSSFLDECVSMSRFPEKHHRFLCKSCPLERCRNEASPEPCRGHLSRKFIKECWSKCGCNMQCGNRVVQRGITCNLQVFFTGEGKGWGLRILDELPKGAFVCEYAGEILTNAELYERTIQNMHNGKHMYPVLLDADWGSEGVLKDEEALCLDTTFYGNVGRFINHRCYDANLAVIPVEVETPDHHYYHLAFFTTKKVEAFEELTWDYGVDFDDDKHPVKAFQCLCGSRYCRGRKHPRKRSKAAAE